MTILISGSLDEYDIFHKANIGQVENFVNECLEFFRENENL